MAIQWIAGDTFTCVSGDTKPTLVPTDTKAIETNTDDVYRFNGTSWVLFSANDKTETLTNKTFSGSVNTISNIPVSAIDAQNAYSYIVYKEGSTYYAKSKSHTNLSNADFVTLIQAAIYALSTGAGNTGGGKIFLKKGLYPQSTTPIHIGNTDYPGSHVVIEGEDKYNTIIQGQTNNIDIFQLWCHTTFRNFTMDGNNLTKRCIITGQPHQTVVDNCIIKKHNDIGIQILNGSTGLRVTNCDFILPNGWQDQLAYATSYWAIIENNYLDKVSVGPGIPGGGGASLTSGGASYARVTGNVIKEAFWLRSPRCDNL